MQPENVNNFDMLMSILRILSNILEESSRCLSRERAMAQELR